MLTRSSFIYLLSMKRIVLLKCLKM